ncbi:hypothetical protein FKM82_016453 [Ascaphus truei]
MVRKRIVSTYSPFWVCIKSQEKQNYKDLVFMKLLFEKPQMSSCFDNHGSSLSLHSFFSLDLQKKQETPHPQ